MRTVVESEIRSSFINCSKGDAKRLSVPRDLAETDFDELDFLGWTDPKIAGRSYIVAEAGDDLIGIALRSEPPVGKTQMCGICLTNHTGGGVSLFAARKTGESGRRGNTVGTYICTDLACSLYARRKKTPSLGNRYREDLPVEERIERVTTNLAAFLARVRE